jgi:hypothetical protein
MVAGQMRPPFPKGHTLRLASGYEHEGTLQARADQVHETLLEVAPWLAEPHFAPAVARYLRAEARALLLHESIGTISAEQGPAKVPARQWEAATAADRLAAQLGSTLGLDPLGHARLRAVAGQAEVIGATLADLQAAGRKARLEAEQRLGLAAGAARGSGEAPSSPVEPLEALEPVGDTHDGSQGEEGDRG